MSRIYQYPVVTEISSDDYLALGSAMNGSRAILASDLAPVIGNKTITERGTYKASDDNMDGYGQVTVDIPYTDIHVASGDIATFEGEDLPLKSLKVAVTPTQDLHGYDGPWAGGAGKNKFDVDSINLNKSYDGNTNNNRACMTVAVPQGTYTISIQSVGTLSEIAVGRSKINYPIPTLSGNVESNALNVTTTSRQVVINETYPYIYIFMSKTDGITLDDCKSCMMQLEAGSTATTYEPYSNICPIIGWSEANVTRCGKNLYFDKLENASITSVGTFENNNSNDVLIARVNEGDTYTFSCNDSGVTVGGLFAEKPTMSSVTYNQSRLYLSQTTPYTITIPQGVKYIAIRYLKTFTTYMIEKGSTATTYEPYNGATYTIDLDGTRYGSELDVLDGVDTDNLGSVDLGDFSWNYNSSLGIFYANFTGYKKYSYNEMPNIMCEAFEPQKRQDVLSNVNGITLGNVGEYDERILIRESSITDLTTFNQIVNGVHMVYELATPITVQLSPTAVKSLEGENNIFANCGAVDVEYQTVWVRPTN